MLWRVILAIIAGIFGVAIISALVGIIAAIIGAVFPIMLFGGVFLCIFATVLVALDNKKKKPH